jgi:hypothetical protein
LRLPLWPRHSTAPPWCSGVFRGTGPPYSVDRSPRTPPCRGPCGLSSSFHHQRRLSPPQGRAWGRQLHPWRFHRPGWQAGLAVILQSLDWHISMWPAHPSSASRPQASALALLTAPPMAHLRYLPTTCLMVVLYVSDISFYMCRSSSKNFLLSQFPLGSL